MKKTNRFAKIKTTFCLLLLFSISATMPLLAIPMMEEGVDVRNNPPARAGVDARANEAENAAQETRGNELAVQENENNNPAEDVTNQDLAIDEPVPENPLPSNETQLMNALKLKRAERTMAGLRVIDATGMTEISSSLFGLRDVIGFFARSNRTYDTAPLILNNGAITYTCLIPAFGNQAASDSVPTIVPAGFKMRSTISSEETLVPYRTPTAAENQEVRALIIEALNVHYGSEFVANNFSQFNAPENRNNPVTIAMVHGLDFLLRDNQGGDLEMGDNHPELTITARQARQFPISSAVKTLVGSLAEDERQQLADAFYTAPADEDFRNRYQEIFDQIDDGLRSPYKYLRRSLWHSADANAYYCRLLSSYKNIYKLVFFGVLLSIGQNLGERAFVQTMKPYAFDGLCEKLPLNINRTYDATDLAIYYDMYRSYRNLHNTSRDEPTTMFDWHSLNTTSYKKALKKEFEYYGYYKWRSPRIFWPGLLVDLLRNKSDEIKRNITTHKIITYLDYNHTDCKRINEEKRKANNQSYYYRHSTFIRSIFTAFGFLFTAKMGAVVLLSDVLDNAVRDGDPLIEYYDAATHQANEAYAHWNGQYAKDAQAPLEKAQLRDNQALTAVSTILADRDNDNQAPLRASVRQSVMQELQNRIRDRGDIIRQLDTRINPSRVRENPTEEIDHDHAL